MGLMILNRGGGIDTTDANATAPQILTGYSGYVNELKINGSMPNHGAINVTFAANSTYTIPAGFHDGSGKIKQALSTQGGSTVTPTTSNKLAVSSGKWVTGDIWAAGDANLAVGNIKENIDIFGVKGKFVGTDCRDATAGAAQILTGYSGYVNQAKVNGSMPNRGAISQSIAANGSYTIPAGWHNGSGKVTQSLSTQAGTTITPGTSNKLAVASGRWTTGNVWAGGDSNLVAGNIKENIDIFGVKGTFVGTNCRDANAGAAQIVSGYSGYVNQSKVSGTMTNRGAINQSIAANGSYTIPSGYHNGSGKVTQSLTTQAGTTITPGTSNKLAVASGRWTTGNVWAGGDSNLTAGNIKENVDIFGVKGTFVGTNCRDANATAARILTGYAGYVNQAKVSGSMPNRGAVTISLAANGAYTIPAGYHNGEGYITQLLQVYEGPATLIPTNETQLVIPTGTYIEDDIWVSGDNNLVAGNIKKDVTIFGVTGTYRGY